MFCSLKKLCQRASFLSWRSRSGLSWPNIFFSGLNPHWGLQQSTARLKLASVLDSSYVAGHSLENSWKILRPTSWYPLGTAMLAIFVHTLYHLSSLCALSGSRPKTTWRSSPSGTGGPAIKPACAAVRLRRTGAGGLLGWP